VQRSYLLALALATVLATTLFASAAAGSGGSAAATPFVDGVALVRFAPGTPAESKAAARAGVAATVDATFELVPGLERLKLRGRDVARSVEALAKNPNVVYAEPDYVVTASVTPNDPLFPQLWGMTKINAPAAWDVSIGSASVVVGDIDTGIDKSHPDLAANIWVNPGEISGNGVDDDGNGYVDDINGWDWVSNDNNPMDDHGHGSHTSGTVGARGNNAVGVTGVNWNVRIAGLKFLSAQGSGSTSNAIKALGYATAKGMKVTNNSWGGGGYSQALYDAISAAGNAGALFVAAAGNNSFNNDLLAHYPSSYDLDNVISVASTTSTDGLSSFSNYGATSVDLGAPGSSILSTTPGNQYQSWSGTSMATPHVAGAAALLWAAQPGMTYAQVRDRLLCTTRPLAALAGKTATGGMLDVGAALGATTCGSPPPPAATMQVGDIVVTLKRKGRMSRATATVPILTATGVPVSSATVTGTWFLNNDPWHDKSGTTNGSGVATIQSNNAAFPSLTLVTFCVMDVTHPSYTFDPEANPELCDGVLVL
jgi:subtilisin family serine protease